MLLQSSGHGVLTLHLLDVRDVNRALALGDAAFDLLGRILPRVPLDHHHVLDDNFARPPVDLDDAPGLALIAPGDHFDHVILLEPDLQRLSQQFALPRHLYDLRRERNDFHKFLVAQLARHRPEYARPNRLVDFVYEHGRIRIEADIAAILAPSLL